jgi:hypothetical protein
VEDVLVAVEENIVAGALLTAKGQKPASHEHSAGFKALLRALGGPLKQSGTDAGGVNGVVVSDAVWGFKGSNHGCDASGDIFVKEMLKS